jgi:hypothetical protein
VTFRRKPDRLSLAVSSPGSSASVSPAEEKIEAPGQGSQQEFGYTTLTGKEQREKLSLRIEINPLCG